MTDKSTQTKGFDVVDGTDQVDGLRIEMSKLEEYLRQIVIWVRIVFIAIVILGLAGLMFYNLISPPDKDVPQEYIDRFANTLSIAALNLPIPGPNNTWKI